MKELGDFADNAETVIRDRLGAGINDAVQLKEAVERIKGNTRRYARKQLTWFKRDEQMRWFHPDNQENIMHYISQHA